MQSMISMAKNGKSVNAFFDVNWDDKQIENITVRDSQGPVGLTDADLIMLTALIEDEVAAIVMDAALDKTEGRAVIA